MSLLDEILQMLLFRLVVPIGLLALAAFFILRLNRPLVAATCRKCGGLLADGTGGSDHATPASDLGSARASQFGESDCPSCGTR